MIQNQADLKVYKVNKMNHYFVHSLCFNQNVIFSPDGGGEDPLLASNSNDLPWHMSQNDGSGSRLSCL